MKSRVRARYAPTGAPARASWAINSAQSARERVSSTQPVSLTGNEQKQSLNRLKTEHFDRPQPPFTAGASPTLRPVFFIPCEKEKTHEPKRSKYRQRRTVVLLAGEDEEGIFCTAHLHEDRCFNCPYPSPEERLKAQYPCSDYKPRGKVRTASNSGISLNRGAFDKTAHTVFRA